jgi:hypothetical protein
VEETKGLTGVVRCDVDTVTFRIGETTACLSLTPILERGQDDPETFVVQVPLAFGRTVARWIEESSPDENQHVPDLIVRVSIALEEEG